MIDKKVLVAGSVGAVSIIGLALTSVIKNNAAEEHFQEAVADLSPFADIKYDDLSIGLFSNDVTLSNVTVTPQGIGAMMYGGTMGLNARSGIQSITIKSLSLSNLDLDGGVPKTMSIEIEDLKVPVPENARRGIWRNVPGPIIARLSEGNAALDFNLEYEVSGDSLEMEVASGIDKWGDVSIEAELDAFKDAYAALSRKVELMENPDADFAMVREVEQAVEEAVQAIEVDKIVLKADDDGLMRALFEGLAEQQGVTTDELVETAVANMEADVERFKERAPLRANAAKAMSEWVKDQGGDFSVTIKPGKEQKKLIALMEELDRSRWASQQGSEFAVTFDH